jgi:hypothetical protein
MVWLPVPCEVVGRAIAGTHRKVASNRIGIRNAAGQGQIMSPELVAVIGLCAFLVLWYGAGYLFNRRHGQRLYHWLRPGLDALGSGWQTTWLGSPSSGVRLAATEAASPFQHLEIILLLENREIVLFWLLDRLRGRRDWLIFKATLDQARPGEVEAIPARSRLAQGLRQQTEQPWKWREGPHGLAIAYRGAGAQQQVARLGSWLEDYGLHLDRLSWRKETPHIQLQLRVAGLLDRPSDKFLADLRSAAIGTAEP